MNYIYAIWRWKKQYRCFEIIAQRFQQKHVNYNLVFFRDEIEIFIISLFETRSRFVPSISRASRRDRDLYLLYLVLRDEIENLLYQILNFEKGTRNKKGFLVIEREFSLLILTRFFEIENSCQCLMLFPIALLFLCSQIEGSPTFVEFLNSGLSVVGAKWVLPPSNESNQEGNESGTRQSNCRDCSRKVQATYYNSDM